MIARGKSILKKQLGALGLAPGGVCVRFAFALGTSRLGWFCKRPGGSLGAGRAACVRPLITYCFFA